MSVMTIEGIVDNGQIKLEGDVRLPEKTRVYVVVPDVQPVGVGHFYSPHIVRRGQGAGLKVEMVEEPKSERPFGLAAGEFVVPEDFDAPLPESIINEFEGR